MSWLVYEWRLLWRSRLALAALLLLLALSALSVYSGLREIERQQLNIARLTELQRKDMFVQEHKHGLEGDAGSVAYYTFLGTWDDPSSMAFLALGMRDTTPYVLRIRALALQSQLHEGEIFNPELALAGRFDFAFVLVYLAPLFLIALLYDLISSERHARRLATLQALPRAGSRLWLHRAILRSLLALACLVLPVLVGAWLNGSLMAVAPVLWTAAAYIVFWSGLSLLVAARGGSSVTNATALVGCWAVLTLVLPTVTNVVLTNAVPVRQGVDLMLAQRQAIHGAWDHPPQATMKQFFITHPEWKNTSPLPAGFHWKWYYAFQQLGDESVIPQVAAYREGLLKRQEWTDRLGWLLPGVGVQSILHRLADTDLFAQLAYQDDVAAFHAQLRTFYYPYLFNDIRFETKDFSELPQFKPTKRSRKIPASSLGALGLVAAIALALGIGAVRCIDRTKRNTV